MNEIKKTKKVKRTDPNKLRNIIIFILMIVILGAGGLYAANKSGSGTGKNKLKPHQETEEVKRDDMRITVKATGNLEPWEKIDLRPEASGKVEKIYIDAGDMVQKGQVVALLDQTSQKIQLERARANVALYKAQLEETKKGYRNLDRVSMEDTILKAEIRFADAEREYNRVKGIYEKGFASEKEYDSAKTLRDQAEQDLLGLKQQLETMIAGGEKNSIERARAGYEMALSELKEAERLLGDATVKAPMSGVVLQRFVSEGSVILSGLSTFSQGEILISIGDVSKMKLMAQVDEGDIGKVKLDQTTLIEVDAYPDEKFEGKVTRISPQGVAGQSVMTTFGVQIEIDNKDRRLNSGFTADVEIVVDEVKNALLVPFAAVLEKDSKYYVFVVDSKDIIEEREIKVDRTNYDFYEVLENLNEGEKVITKGRPNKLKSEKKGKKGEGGKIVVQVD